ncbi:MAG: Rne/Rng family ribonuclease [Pseudotabrizicola sp.]|uniref:Rne/Rng family ribonuclease n=1 Tax=Pseudotabrizicola sp. TaxID=2939647 RepID=UPI00273127DB|nr:Rne/Rng family ribonuclease [Pseudotabrizicola sp.]MDP2082898.1 Rne/Rng family ribonuclease [Pseudotabrizicola sp.]MDZ7574430.1 Rne/Rng family ribonuclease [Pseudotabrizicola sp.]
MAKKMLIDATHSEETRVVVVDGNKVEEFDFETVNKRQLAGNIYLAKVTRVEPSLQAAFVDYGGNRHGFLAFAEIHPDYYQIPVADRKALIEEERAYARAEEEEENRRSRKRSPRPKPAAEDAKPQDAVTSGPAGMDVVDLGDDAEADAPQVEQSDQGHDENGHDHGTENGGENGSGEAPYRAMDHASETDDDIESIAEEDVSEEISQPRKPRARRYKIQEVVKVRQIMLVQVVKEERGNKGAALTTYLSLAGRYCVLMPNTARGGGISRKITNAADRKKLKDIAAEIEVPEGAGLIVRTAGAKRTKAEIKRDYEYLMRLWEQIRELTLKSIAPAPIYEEGNLIKRSIRDLYNREIDEVLVEGEDGFRTAKDFMRMIMPSHAKAVQRYTDPTPLFAKYQVEGYLGGMFNPTVQLKSGGYIVIGITEALVAVDVNSGRATKEGSIEDTALKTNLEAAEEVARQLRLRDLAGLIVIDFIDMEERRNNAAVEKKLKDKLKTDRARIQVGRISGFGLMEMSRQRLRPGMLESTTQPCPHCHGTGLIRSDDSMALQVLRALEEEGTRKRSKEVLLKAPVGIINYLINQKREHIALIEARYGMSVRLEADPSMISPDYTIEKFKTALRVVPEPGSVISGNSSLMGAAVDEDEDEDLPIEDDIEDEAEPEAEPEAKTEPSADPRQADGNGTKKKRRRRRRRKGSGANGTETDGNGESEDGESDGEDDADASETPADAAAEPAAADPVVTAAADADAPIAEAEPAKKPTRSRSRKPKAQPADTPAAPAEVTAEPVAPESAPEPVAEPVAEVAKKPTRSRSRKPKVAPADAPVMPEAVVEPVAVAAAVPTTMVQPAPMAEQPAPVAEAAPVPPAPTPEPAPVADTAAAVAPEDTGPEKPKRKGWWSLSR